MVMIFLNKQVVVLFDDKVLISNDFSFFHFLEQFVVDFRPFLNESKFSRIAMRHSSVELPLKQESYDKPINSNKTISFTLNEKHNDSDDDCEWNLKHQIHIFEQCEYQLQIHILQVNNLALWYPIPTLPCYP
jgi:hypothetical protein